VCVHNTDCSIRSAWRNVQSMLGRILGRISLKDLLRPEGAMDMWMQARADTFVPLSTIGLGGRPLAQKTPTGD
jgi:DNA-binding IscR family transcriptional regulator